MAFKRCEGPCGRVLLNHDQVFMGIPFSITADRKLVCASCYDKLTISDNIAQRIGEEPDGSKEAR